jgi:apolipoprotein N-acyltransferase
MIRCANTGISCVIDSNGTITSHYVDATGNEIDAGGVFAGAIKIPVSEDENLHPSQPTLYEAWGDWIVLISSVVSVMLGLWYFFRSRPNP